MYIKHQASVMQSYRCKRVFLQKSNPKTICPTFLMHTLHLVFFYPSNLMQFWDKVIRIYCISSLFCLQTVYLGKNLPISIFVILQPYTIILHVIDIVFHWQVFYWLNLYRSQIILYWICVEWLLWSPSQPISLLLVLEMATAHHIAAAQSTAAGGTNDPSNANPLQNIFLHNYDE